MAPPTFFLVTYFFSFSIQYFYILQFTITFVDNMCDLAFKKSRNGSNSIFMNVTKNNQTFCQKKCFSLLKNAKNSTFEHTKTKKIHSYIPTFLHSYMPAYIHYYIFTFYHSILFNLIDNKVTKTLWRG